MSVADDLCARAIELVDGRAEAQATASAGRSSLTRFANSFIHQNVAEDRASLGLTVVVDGRLASASTTSIDDDGIRRFVDATIEAARLRPVDADWPGLSGPAAMPSVDHYDEATAVASPTERAAIVKAFVDAGGELKAAGYCATSNRDYGYANTAGHTASGRDTIATFEGIHQLVPGVSAGLATDASVRLADLDGAAAGAHAAATARAAADPVELEPGDYEVVLQPECVATLLVFLGFDSFNAKAHLEGESCIQLGAVQFDPSVAIWDDVLDGRAVGIGYDAEGTPKRRVDLVTEGVSVGLAHDRRTARKAGTESTGHAIPGGESWGAFPQNLFMAGGDASVDDLIAGVERGLLVSELNYCRILDTKTMVATGLTRNGTFLIENGAVTKPIRGLRFTQSFLGALGPGNVRALGAARYAASNEEEVLHVPSAHLGRWHFTGGAKG
ncbi:MAG TPA: TldD/PmbA family protein [Acidimicrobiales bacterium]|nr:TldD/PmbA family protein [Acidimicrobiales bacterium]